MVLKFVNPFKLFPRKLIKSFKLFPRKCMHSFIETNIFRLVYIILDCHLSRGNSPLHFYLASCLFIDKMTPLA